MTVGRPRINFANVSTATLDFIGKLNNASIPTRYPEDLAKTVGSYPKKVAQEYLKKTKEVIEWLKRDPRLKRS